MINIHSNAIGLAFFPNNAIFQLFSMKKMSYVRESFIDIISMGFEFDSVRMFLYLIFFMKYKP